MRGSGITHTKTGLEYLLWRSDASIDDGDGCHKFEDNRPQYLFHLFVALFARG